MCTLQAPKGRSSSSVFVFALDGASRQERGPDAYKAQENDFVVGADLGNTNVMTVAVAKCGEAGIEGNLRQKDMRLLKFSIARYYRESGMVNARGKR